MLFGVIGVKKKMILLLFFGFLSWKWKSGGCLQPQWILI